jgi:hypothetical protein
MESNWTATVRTGLHMVAGVAAGQCTCGAELVSQDNEFVNDMLAHMAASVL